MLKRKRSIPGKMKVSLVVPVLLGLSVRHAEGSNGWRLRGRRGLTEQYPLFHPKSFEGCLEVKGDIPRKDQSLILATCSKQQGWRLDGDGLFHTALDDSMCMQASRDAPPEDGDLMRLFPCDKNNSLQRFVHIPGGGADAGIRLKDDKSFCVVFRGTTANVNVDPIILKKCNKVEVARRGWSA